jgi:hypothetical protein
MPRRRGKFEIERERDEAIAAATREYFGGITKGEAIEVFKVLSILAQFPGANPPEPLTGHEVIWSSTLRVGDSIAKQVFSVQVTYKGVMFFLSANGDRGLQLPDSSFIPLENWDYQAARVTARVTGGNYGG